jgi:hypothetical protein
VRSDCIVQFPRETPTRQEVIKCALAHNSITSSVVETTYIDTLASIQAAREVIPEAVIGRDLRDIGLRKALLEIMKFGVSPQSSERAIHGDILVHTYLLYKCIYALVMELASSYGHEWFLRNASNAVLQNNGVAFVFSTLKLWLGKQADVELRKLTDFSKTKLFREFFCCRWNYSLFSDLFKQFHTVQRKAMLAVLSTSTYGSQFAKPSSPQFHLCHSLRTTILSSQGSNILPMREQTLQCLLFRAWNVWKSPLYNPRRFQHLFLGSAVCPQGSKYLLGLRTAREPPLPSVSSGPYSRLLLLKSLLPPNLPLKRRKAGADPQLVRAQWNIP